MTKQDLDFGHYCLIEQKRYGIENEMYLYKVIGRAKCNYYRPVPVNCKNMEKKGNMTDCVKAICCGVQETEVETFRLCDVELNDKFIEKRNINFNTDVQI